MIGRVTASVIVVLVLGAGVAFAASERATSA
jgi:hypothetical protein